MKFMLDEIDATAEELLKTYADYHLYAFYGELGAGKTTLIKALGRVKGIQDPMGSPSFAIIHTYQSAHGDTIYHFDCYRLNSIQEALDIGVEDYFYSGNRCWIEWPEMVTGLLPEKHLEIRINLLDRGLRELILIEHG